MSNNKKVELIDSLIDVIIINHGAKVSGYLPPFKNATIDLAEQTLQALLADVLISK